MFNGPGKYDDLLTQAREAAEASGALLVIMHGNQGNGFSVQMPGEDIRALPALLDIIAKQIRADIAALDIAAMMDSKGSA